MFTARYGLGAYIKQIRLVFKGLKRYDWTVTGQYSRQTGFRCDMVTICPLCRAAVWCWSHEARVCIMCLISLCLQYTHPFILGRLTLSDSSWGENRPHSFFMFYCFSFVDPSIHFFVLELVICPVVLLARLYHPCADVVLGMLFTMRNQPLDSPFHGPSCEQ